MHFLIFFQGLLGFLQRLLCQKSWFYLLIFYSRFFFGIIKDLFEINFGNNDTFFLRKISITSFAKKEKALWSFIPILVELYENILLGFMDLFRRIIKGSDCWKSWIYLFFSRTFWPKILDFLYNRFFLAFSDKIFKKNFLSFFKDILFKSRGDFEKIFQKPPQQRPWNC